MDVVLFHVTDNDRFVYWPAPSSILRGLEWSQCLKRLIVCSLIVIKFSNFSLFHPSLFIQYSTEECSTVQYKAAGHRTHKISLRVKKRFQNQCRVYWRE